MASVKYHHFSQKDFFFPLTHNHLTQPSWQHIEKLENSFLQRKPLLYILGAFLASKLSPYQLDPSMTPDLHQLRQELESLSAQCSPRGPERASSLLKVAQ